MTLRLPDYRAKLINKILFSNSQDEVKRYIETAIRKLQQHGVGGHIVARFIEKTLDELEAFSPMNKNALQWSNIKVAKVFLFRIQRDMNSIQH